MITLLLDKARALGACRKTDGVTTLDDLLNLFRSPQGLEFCLRHHFPSHEEFGISP